MTNALTGKTALHILARHKQDASKQIVWNGEQQTPEKAWLKMAEIFISKGCDPRIADHSGMDPSQVAKESGNHDLADFLHKVFFN